MSKCPFWVPKQGLTELCPPKLEFQGLWDHVTTLSGSSWWFGYGGQGTFLENGFGLVGGRAFEETVLYTADGGSTWSYTELERGTYSNPSVQADPDGGKLIVALNVQWDPIYYTEDGVNFFQHPDYSQIPNVGGWRDTFIILPDKGVADYWAYYPPGSSEYVQFVDAATGSNVNFGQAPLIYREDNGTLYGFSYGPYNLGYSTDRVNWNFVVNPPGIPSDGGYLDVSPNTGVGLVWSKVQQRFYFTTTGSSWRGIPPEIYTSEDFFNWERVDTPEWFNEDSFGSGLTHLLETVTGEVLVIPFRSGAYRMGKLVDGEFERIDSPLDSEDWVETSIAVDPFNAQVFFFRINSNYDMEVYRYY